jgi:hypothetical protein
MSNSGKSSRNCSEEFGGYYDGGDKTGAEKTGEAENKAGEGKPNEELIYPDAKKTDEEVAAETKAAEEKAAAEKLAEGKTEEELAAEKKAAEAKTEEEKAAEAKKAEEDKKGEGDKKSDTPDVVKAEDLKFGENAQVNEAVQDKFLTFVNDTKLTVEQAQALVGLQQELYMAQAEAHQEQIVTWEKEAGKDKEIIGDTGDKMDETLAIAKKGFEALKIKGLMPWLKDTGNGSNPMFIRMGLRIGTAISEDSFRTGGLGGKKDPKSDKDVLYPNQT